MKPIINQVCVTLAVILLCSCGNSYSVYPFYQEEDVVEMDELLGIWQEMDMRDSIPYDGEAIKDSLKNANVELSMVQYFMLPIFELDSIYEPAKERWFWMVEKDEKGGYFVSHTNYTEIFTYHINPFVLDDNVYLDIFPGSREHYEDTYHYHSINLHSMVRISFRDNYALLEYLAIDEFEAGLNMLYPDVDKRNKDLPDSLKIKTPTKNIIIDETEQIQNAIRPYVAQDSSWFPELILKRK